MIGAQRVRQPGIALVSAMRSSLRTVSDAVIADDGFEHARPRGDPDKARAAVLCAGARPVMRLGETGST